MAALAKKKKNVITKILQSSYDFISILEGTLNDNNITIEEINEGAYFPIASQIIAAAFILSLSIIIMNLLFGLAVADIQVSTYIK